MDMCKNVIHHSDIFHIDWCIQSYKPLIDTVVAVAYVFVWVAGNVVYFLT